MNWQEFTFRAFDLLRRHHDRSLYGFFSAVQLIESQPMQNPRCWTVLHDSSDPGDMSQTPSYSVLIHTWAMQDDYPDPDLIEDELGCTPDSPEFQAAIKARLPAMPTIRISNFTIPEPEIGHLLLRIKGITLPIVFQGDQPFAGPSYELIVGHYLSGAIFRWWGYGPPEWKELTSSVAELLQILHAYHKKMRKNGDIP